MKNWICLLVLLAACATEQQLGVIGGETGVMEEEISERQREREGLSELAEGCRKNGGVLYRESRHDVYQCVDSRQVSDFLRRMGTRDAMRGRRL